MTEQEIKEIQREIRETQARLTVLQGIVDTLKPQPERRKAKQAERDAIREHENKIRTGRHLLERTRSQIATAVIEYFNDKDLLVIIKPLVEKAKALKAEIDALEASK